jgi:hypothetical protein
MIYTPVLRQGGQSVRSPADLLEVLVEKGGVEKGKISGMQETVICLVFSSDV